LTPEIKIKNKKNLFKMKQSVFLSRNISLFILSFGLFLASCSKDKDIAAAPGAAFAGQYQVVDDTETYTLKVESKGGNNYYIREFGGFLNVPLNATADGSTLNIPKQSFTNPSGKTLTVVGKGFLTTKSKKDDTITFQYTVSGFTNYDGDFTGTRK
jgi:hypothetical protein